MDHLFWPNVPLLTSVHLQEEVTCKARDALSACINASLQPLRRQVNMQNAEALTLMLECILGARPAVRHMGSPADHCCGQTVSPIRPV